jgi:hypothetical protein
VVGGHAADCVRLAGAFDNAPMTPLRAAAALVAALLAACSPTFNWREVKLPGAAGHAMFPCRPSREQRMVPLAGRPVALTILSCRTGETMFALGVADVGEPGQVGAALEALKGAAAANIGGMPVPASAPAVEGAASHAAAGSYRLQGRLPDGHAVQARLAVFTQGTRVYQATVFSQRLAAEPADTFFAGLSLR